VLHLSSSEREEWSNTIGQAFDLIGFHEPSLDLVDDYTWFVVPLQNDRTGFFSSMSFNNLPNAVYTTQHSELMFAETLVHESDHHWLYSLSRSESFWIVPEHEQQALYRSPWREDPRPLDGILRGASAFVKVGSFWASLALSLPKHHNSQGWIEARAVLSNFQAVDALQTVTKFGGLSKCGQELVDNLKQTARNTRKDLSVSSSFAKLLKKAKNLQHDHDDQWATSHSHITQNSNNLSLEDYVNL